MTLGSRAVHLQRLAFLAAWVSPGEAEENWLIEKLLCGKVGLDGRFSVYAEQSKIPVALAGMAGAYLSTKTNLVPLTMV